MIGTSDICFVYSGQGAQWKGMGVTAYANNKEFAATVRRIAKQFPDHETALMASFEAGDNNSELFNGASLVVYQIAMTNALANAGLVPTAVCGFSLGEIGAAYASGMLSEGEAFDLAIHRTRIALSYAPDGLMAVAGISVEEFRDITEKFPLKECYIACHNAPTILSIGGPRNEMVLLKKRVSEMKRLWKDVDTNGKAYHSPSLKESLSDIQKELAGRLPETLATSRRPNLSTKFVSTSSYSASSIIPPHYFANSLVTPVMFHNAVTNLPSGKVLEIGPSSGLLKMISNTRQDLHMIPVLKRNTPRSEQVFGDFSPVLKTLGPRIALFFAGEGTHMVAMDISILKTAPIWFELENVFKAAVGENLLEFLTREVGTPEAPNSTLVTTVVNMLHASIWALWGFKPDAVIGHSSGDVAAAHAAGLYTTEEAVQAAVKLGQFGARLRGGMIVTKMPKETKYPINNLYLAGVNVSTKEEDVVTLCGEEEDVRAFLEEKEYAKRISSEHPWHHPSYAKFASSELPNASRKLNSGCEYVSATGKLDGDCLGSSFWRKWCCSPANIPEAFTALRGKGERSWVVIECGAHPIARRAAQSELKPLVHVASAVNSRRGANEQLRKARSLLFEAGVLKERLACALETANLYKRAIDFSVTWDGQGISSLEKVRLAKKLAVYFPGLEIADMFNYTSMDQLLNEWDTKSEISFSKTVDNTPKSPVDFESATAGMVLGVAVHLPPNVLTEEELWKALVDEQIAVDDKFGAARLTQLDLKSTGKNLGISAAELKVTDPQHILALKLVDQLWKNITNTRKDKILSNLDRVGVYLGIWQTQPIQGPSVYSILGSAQCALASRIANTYDFQGPAVTINTACSSSLVAVDAMMKDLRMNRIDYAIVGGVNLFGSNNEEIVINLRRAKFLSPTNRCHTFSGEADGYVRAEGGICFLVERDDGYTPCRGLICGSYVNQNSQRKPITSVDPVAQARLITSACHDAGVTEEMVNVIEMHGTGTRIGDPVEVSALASTVGKGSSTKDNPCFLTASKMHFGHLESAAGALGLAKALLMVSQRQVPCYSVPLPNELVMKAMGSSRLALVAKGGPAPLPSEPVIGISSFGFSGSNAHVIIKGVPDGRNSTISVKVVSVQPPQTTNTLQTTELRKFSANSEDDCDSTSPGIESHAAAVSRVVSVCNDLGLNIEEVNCDFNVSVLDLGLDSLGIAELSTILGLDSVEDILANPTIAGIATLIGSDSEPTLEIAKTEPNGVRTNKARQETVTHCCNSGSCCIDPASTVKQLQSNFPIIESALPQVESYKSFVKKTMCMEVEWIRTTHVGSLPRIKNQTLDDVVAAQIAAGIDIINDGEFQRENYISDVVSRIEGLHVSKHLVAMPSAADMREVSDYSRRFSGVNGLITLNPKAPAKCGLACYSAPRYIGSSTLKPAIMELVDAAAQKGKGPESVFWSVPSPGTMALFCRNETFESYQEYVHNLALALKGEYEAIVECGVTIQIDAPGFAMGRHTLHAAMTDDQFVDRILRVNVAALNVALENIPEESIRVHVCWGNYPGPHTHDIGAERIWPHLINLKARYLLIEMANARHAGDIQVLRGFASKLGDKVIVPGVIDTTSARVEHPMLIAKKLIELASIVGPQRVMAGTDCGFSSTSKSSAITGDLVWLKLKSMVQGARLASRTLFNTNVPVDTPYISQSRTARVLLCTTGAQMNTVRKLYNALLSQSSVVVFPYIVNTESEKDLKSSYKWRIDWPILCVSTSPSTDDAVKEICADVNENNCAVKVDGIQVTRQPSFPLYSSEINESLKDGDTEALVKEIVSRTARINVFDKRVLSSHGAPLKIEDGNKKQACDVVVVGAGVLGLYAATRILQSGRSVIVLEKRNVVGGIWAYYANSTSQVNSSEGAYSFKDVLGDDTALRDHSSSSEVLQDISKLADGLADNVRLGAQVMRICNNPAGGYQVYTKGEGGQFTTFVSDGVILAINDRVGRPRTFRCDGMETSNIQIVPGIADASTGVDWKGKRVVIYGYGAFAIEALRTSLEAGAEHVVILARRRGCVCPKVIDYDNFINEFDDDFKHDVKTNAVQVQRWRRLYMASKATPPACWPSKIKPTGHTISVSDIFFIAHWMNKVTTKVGVVAGLSDSAIILESGEKIDADIFVPCIGFERNTDLCEDLTGCQEVCETNYLDKHMMYLADAEIDDGAFNSFFGSSVLEYAKFFIEVYIQGLDREDEIGDMLWGSDVPRFDITKRKWSQYIRATLRITKADEKMMEIARTQIDRRTERMMKHLPPQAYEASNRQEWKDIHTFLNNGVPVPVQKQLPYFKDL